MKKFGILLLATAVILSVCACAAKEETTEPSTSAPTVSTPVATESTGQIPDATFSTDSTAATTIPSTQAPEVTIPEESTAPTVAETVPAPTEPTQPPVMENDTFGFTAVLSGDQVVEMGNGFRIEVTTTNISGANVTYQGSSVIVGASITLTLEVDGQTITLMPDPVIQPRDLSQKIIAPGETITRTWSFSDFVGAVEGTYDLHFNFMGYQGMIEDFVTLQ